MEEEQIMEIWDLFVEYIPEKNREVAANQYVDYLLGNDVSLSTLQSVTGYDDHLDHAIELISSEHSEEEDDFQDEDY